MGADSILGIAYRNVLGNKRSIMNEQTLRTAKRQLLKKIMTEIFRHKGIVLSYEDKRWLLGVGMKVWDEHLKTLCPREDFKKLTERKKEKS